MALTSISIPNNVKTIHSEAFTGCFHLANLDLGNGVETINSNAFALCFALKSVTIPDSVKEITGNPFAGCEGIEAFYGKFVSADNSTIIVDNQIIAIANYKNLTEYTIPNKITKIADYTYLNWSNIQTINIPNSVTEIGIHAFSNCSCLQTINIPEGVTEIKYGTFQNCDNLTQITLPNKLKTIADRAFLGAGLTDITIPESVTDIQTGVFARCDKLTSFRGKFASEDNRCLIINNELVGFAPAGLTSYTIPNNVTSIGHYAFDGCSSLTEIIIPNSVTSIGYYAFNGCTSLAGVYCKAITPPTIESGVFDDNAPGRIIYVPRESVDAYKSAPGWSNYADAIVGYDF